MTRSLVCGLALFGLTAVSQAGELDKEAKAAPTVPAVTATAGSELDAESPAAAHNRGGWGYGGGYYGGGWGGGYRSYYGGGWGGGWGNYYGGYRTVGYGGWGGGWGGYYPSYYRSSYSFYSQPIGFGGYYGGGYCW